MKSWMKRFFFILALFIGLSNSIWVSVAVSQDTNKDYFPTPNTVIDAKPDPKKQQDKEKQIRYIITNDTKNTLAGNRCFEEVTTRMGFQYLAVPAGQPPNKNGFSRWWHNFGVKFIILMKNGPFWKMKVNKKFEQCKFGSGDYVG